MAGFEHARALLRMAHKDFNALTGMLDDTLFADEIFGFHVQQAEGKALKTWLCTCGIVYHPTRDMKRGLPIWTNRWGGSLRSKMFVLCSRS